MRCTNRAHRVGGYCFMCDRDTDFAANVEAQEEYAAGLTEWTLDSEPSERAKLTFATLDEEEK